MNRPTRENEDITPPSSLLGPPLTPPPTDEKETLVTRRILQRVAEHKPGDTESTQYEVDKRVWAAVSPILLQEDKLRVNYFPTTQSLCLRMPTKVHEQFSRSLSGRILEQVRQLSRGSGSVADFAKDVRDVGSATIRPRDPEYGIHDPDSSFQHLKSPSPTVIIEVAHSQSGRRLRTLAEEYLLGSDLAIRVVVGVDIEYSKSKRAAFSVWRAELQGPEDDKAWVVESTVADQVDLMKPHYLTGADAAQVFRNDDGEPNSDQKAGLCLRLDEFADEKTCRTFTDIKRDIFVSSSELYQYLEEAEVIAMRDEFAHTDRTLRLKKRRRTQTPEEQLNDHDEEAYVEDEEHVSKRRDMDDASYKEGSSERS